MRKTLIGLTLAMFVIVAALGFAACGSTSEKAETPKADSTENTAKSDHDMSEMDHSKMDAKDHKTTDYSAYKTGQTADIANAAEQIDKALAEKDKAKAVEGANALIAAFKKFDASKLDAGKKKEYDEIAESAVEHAEHIVKSEMDHQMEHFEGLSKDLKDLFALIGEKKDA